MKSPNIEVEEQHEEVEQSVKGTLFSVGFVGFIILITWVLLFVIYMYRY